MSKDFSRRKFLERLAIGGAAGASLPLLGNLAPAAGGTQALPHRTLGGTGASVSILAFGCGSRFLMYQDEDRALAALNRALDLGIDYLDTAYAYGDGKSETRVGKVMATRRKEVWLATKIPDRTRDAFLKQLEDSLKRLQTDHVDLVHIHSLGHAEDLAKIEAPDGALKGLLQAKEQKMTRFIGMTSHTDGAVMAQAIERHPLDCVQMALNPSGNGEFEETALVAAHRKNLGIIAMKAFGQEFLIGQEAGKADVDSLLRFAMTLPVAAAVVGMPKVEMLEHNVELARNFSPLSAAEMDRLRRDLGVSRQGLEKRLVGHLDGPTNHPEVFWA
jgi:aryl-alcohol dehydrogenase-like predicted oxidoreductase